MRRPDDPSDGKLDIVKDWEGKKGSCCGAYEPIDEKSSYSAVRGDRAEDDFSVWNRGVSSVAFRAQVL